MHGTVGLTQTEFAATTGVVAWRAMHPHAPEEPEGWTPPPLPGPGRARRFGAFDDDEDGGGGAAAAAAWAAAERVVHAPQVLR